MGKNAITNWNITSIPKEELIMRRNKVIEGFTKNGAEAMVFFNTIEMFYLVGGVLTPFERPMVFILKSDSSTALLVPRLELEHAHHVTKGIDRIECYPEYPGEKHPMIYLAELLKSMNIDNCCVAADNDGYGSKSGYRGPKLSSVCSKMNLLIMPHLVEDIMKIKSPYEQMLIKESARWANLAHKLLQDYTRPGLTELEVVNKVVADSAKIMLDTLGVNFSIIGLGRPMILSGYRGQIGKNSYFPHAVVNNATFKEGDNLVTGASAVILGYNSELERVLFIGEPTKEQEKYYNHAVELQSVVFNSIKPGKKCSDVDNEVMKYYEENNLMDYWRHHTGHALGIGAHEAPFFDIGDDTIIEPGMVFSVEPGIYVKDLGGFRLSDTVLVTEHGIEMITYYPKEIDKIICKTY